MKDPTKHPINLAAHENPVQTHLEDGTLKDLDDEQITEGIHAALAERYSAGDGWHLFTEVGAPDQRRIDALALSAWRSRGYEVHGLEVKASRSDWLSEVKDPDKQRWWMNRVDRFYLVAPTHVCDTSELPKGWGLIRFQNDGSLRKVKDSNPPGEPTREGAFLGILARQVDKAMKRTPAEKEIQDAYDKGYDKGKAAGKREAGGRRVERLEDSKAQLEAAFKRFEEEVGIPLTQWNSELEADTLEAVKAVYKAQRMAPKAAHEVKVLASRFDERADRLRELVEGIPGADTVDDEPDGLLMIGGGI